MGLVREDQLIGAMDVRGVPIDAVVLNVERDD